MNTKTKTKEMSDREVLERARILYLKTKTAMSKIGRRKYGLKNFMDDNQIVEISRPTLFQAVFNKTATYDTLIVIKAFIERAEGSGGRHDKEI